MTLRVMRASPVLVFTVALLLPGTAPVVADAGTGGSGRPVPGARATGLQVGRLTVEHQENPLGVDVAGPRLGWVLHSVMQGARQSAYQVQVSSTPHGAGDVWDSGRVPSATSFDVAYAGPDLRSRTRYHWRVRVWDAGRRASAWSGAAWFETAFLDADDFHGDWIGARAKSATTSLQGASWIWHPPRATTRGGQPSTSTSRPTCVLGATSSRFRRPTRT